MESIKGTMIGKPLAGLLFGKPFMVCAFSTEEVAEDSFITEGPPEYEWDMRVMSLDEPIRQWWKYIVDEFNRQRLSP